MNNLNPTDSNIQSTNVSSEHVETTVPEVASESINFNAMSREELANMAEELLADDNTATIKDKIDAIKQAFYKKLKTEQAELVDAVEDEIELRFKAIMGKYKALRASDVAISDAKKEENLAKKMHILDELEKLISSEDISAIIPIFRQLQQEWKSIDKVPQSKETEIWKIYSQYQEKFYDLIKIDNELREYDFKKNLEQKSALCEAAERLAEEEEDPIKSFKLLQILHDEWREIGPVARDLRESIWNRFKAASANINKRHQDYFESIKDLENELIEQKNKIAEWVEQIDYAALNSHKLWEDKTNEVIEWQEKWKVIGPLSRKANNKAFKRFRTACDEFFEHRNQFFKNRKDEFSKNLDAKRKLCEIAEGLKDSQDWKSTSDKLIALQKEWKTVGPTNKKQSDSIWQRFNTACDYFFEQKEKNYSSKNSVEHENLALKKAVIEEIEAFVFTDNTADDIARLKELAKKFTEIGHVPFKDKDKIFKKFKDATDKKFDKLHKDRHQAHKKHDKDGGGINDRYKLVKHYDALRNEIATIENNIGFFANSKKGQSMVDMMNKKIERLKEELDELVNRINEIDKSL